MVRSLNSYRLRQSCVLIASALVSAISISMASQVIAAPISERLESIHRSFLDDRREALPQLSDPFGVPNSARVVVETPKDPLIDGMGWKRNVVATVFWVGEESTDTNPTPNHQSAWDPNWKQNYGGEDTPNRRSGWNPAGFTPKTSPFYCALPYNDVMKGGVHRPEASQVIPWFWRDYRGDGISVCKGRWLAIHYNGRVCYAQWEDVGPFEVDHWEYVFGDAAPRANDNQAAGIDVSPAIRDYLQLASGGRVQWRFVHDHQVPDGPWKDWAQK